MNKWNLQNDIVIHQVLKGHGNAYLIVDNGTNTLVDTGKLNKQMSLRKNLQLLIPKNQKLDYLVLTHTHYDHCQNAAWIKKEFACNIIVSLHENEFAIKGATPIPKGTNAFTKAISKLGSFYPTKLGYTPITADIILEPYPFNIPNTKINIIDTPGHSKGSISILVNNEFALVGDTLFGIFPNSVFPPYADDIELLLGSWKKLLESTCTTFLPGHGKALPRALFKKCAAKF